jgi:hypothetical protein
MQHIENKIVRACIMCTILIAAMALRVWIG